jgi:hypothetical protein
VVGGGSSRHAGIATGADAPVAAQSVTRLPVAGPGGAPTSVPPGATAMVLTCPVAMGRTTQRDQASGHSRRKLLRAGVLLALGGAAVPLTGCDLFDRDEQPTPAPDPLRPLLDESVGLAAAHRAGAAAHPELADRLGSIAEAHTAHAAELARVIGVPVPSPPAAAPTPAADPAGTLAALRAMEKTGQQSATQACASAPADRAALLGSIVAARATHQEALR